MKYSRFALLIFAFCLHLHRNNKQLPIQYHKYTTLKQLTQLLKYEMQHIISIFQARKEGGLSAHLSSPTKQ